MFPTDGSEHAATRAAGSGVETAVDTGHPAERIVEYAIGTDLIVTGTSGDEYERNVVGSVS